MARAGKQQTQLTCVEQLQMVLYAMVFCLGSKRTHLLPILLVKSANPSTILSSILAGPASHSLHEWPSTYLTIQGQAMRAIQSYLLDVPSHIIMQALC